MDAPMNVIEKPEFNPADHLITIKGKGGDKPFLPAYDAVAWFWAEYPAPRGSIIPFIIDIEQKLVRAEIRVDGNLIAAADVKGDGNTSLEKLQTSAVRRALAFAGYGTVSAMAHEEDYDEAKTQARGAEAAHDIGTDKARDKLGAGKNRKVDTSLRGQLMSAVDHPYYANSNPAHLKNAIEALFREEILYERMPLEQAKALVYSLGTFRENGTDIKQAIEEVRKLAAKPAGERE